MCLLALSASTLAQAQIQGSALDYMLQRPRVTKSFEHKRPFDHLFIDGGAGFNLVGTKHPKAGVQANFNVGDWITPEHGLRLHVNGGAFQIAGEKPKFGGAGLDYLLNITALAQPGSSYDQPRTLEVYGIAGIDYTLSRLEGNNGHGLGAHLGLRGQVALSPFTYFYVEPRIGLVQDDATQAPSWHGYRPLGSASLGLGYRLPQSARRSLSTDSMAAHKRWADGMFIGVAGGPLFFANAQPSSWQHNAGGRLAGSIGKWFDPYNALRLTANATTFKQQGANRVKAVGGQVDYLLNLHNALGGLNPDRRFWFNGVAGVSYNVTSDGEGERYRMLGLGGGLQANVRLSRDIDLTIEPRLDAYRENYAPHLSTAGKWDLTASMLAGLTYPYHDRSALNAPADPFEQTAWHDHTFVELGMGANVAVNRPSFNNFSEAVRPQAYAAVGKWFTPVHGARIWGELGQVLYAGPQKRYKHYDVGVDYMLNFTNLFYGYRAYRPFEFTGAAGVNVSHRQKRDALFLGGDASLRGIWHVNPFLGIFVEPKLQVYGKRYLPSSFALSKVDLLASATAGVQFNLQGFDRATAYERMSEEGHGLRRSISVAGGLATQANHLRSSSYYSPVGRVSYTQWYTPLAAWRVNAQGMVRRSVNGHSWAQVAGGVDWMTDLTAQTYGYDISRPLSIRAFAGVNAGVDMGGSHTYFSPDLHAGGQMAVRLTDNWHLLLEPQVAYECSKRFKHERLGRWMPQLLLGLDYSIERHAANEQLKAKPSKPHFVTVSLGTGAYTGNFQEMSPLGRKMTFVGDVSYGQWKNHVSGYHFGLGNTVAQRRGKGNESITSLHAAYMMNLTSAMTGQPTDENRFQLTGLAGASLNFSSREGRSAKVAPGLQAALQAGVRVTPNVELYLEPAAAVFGKGIESKHSSRPIEGELRLSLGSKFKF